MTVYLTRRLTFNAAHKLWVDDWTKDKNLSIFGKCANPNWHGHNYELFVTVKGKPDPVRGYIIDAKLLKKIVNEKVVDKLDHSNLNLDVDFIPRNTQPTTENLVILIWNELAPTLEAEGCQLHCIKLKETENIYCEYYGES